MKSLSAVASTSGQTTVNLSVAGVADLYEAAAAMVPGDTKPLAGLGDMERVNIVTTVGAMRRLIAAVGKSGEVP